LTIVELIQKSILKLNMTNWWPEVTVDVLESDLKRFFPTEKRQVSEHRNSLEEEDEVECDWEIVSSEPSLSYSNKFSKFRNLEKQLGAQRARIDELQLKMCSATFHTLMADVGLHSGNKIDRFSPLNFCFSQTETFFDDSVKVTSFDVSESVKMHASQFFADPNVFLSQDAKDIQRDSVCLNSQLLIGSECGGYQTILEVLVECIGAAGVHADDEWEDIEQIAQVILSLANRTFSGGISFDKVLSLFQEKWLVSPVSNEAEPLDVIVTRASALVRAHTKYALMPLEDYEGDVKKFVNANLFIEVPLVDVRGKSKAHLFIQSDDQVR
jgi:hypothetical protein